MKSVRSVLMMGLLAGGIMCASVFGQTPQPNVVEVTKSPPRALYYGPASLAGQAVYLAHDGGPNPYELQADSAQLAQQYVKAEKESEKSDLRKKLQDSLNKQFDMHIDQQQKELKELEKQIAHLRSVLEKRQESKESIVKRRMDQLIHEAEGLGWNAPGGGNDFWTPRPLTGYPHQPGQLTPVPAPARR